MISVAGLYYAFGTVDFNELQSTLVQVNGWYILLSVGLIIFSIAVRAERWQLLLEPIRSIRFQPLFSSTMIGYFGNGVMPFRLGEVLRAYSISLARGVDASSAFGTIILERILDLLGLVAGIILFAFFYPVHHWGGRVMMAIVILSISAFLFILFLGRAQSHLLEKFERMTFFQNPFGQRSIILIKNLLSGLTSIKETKHVGQIVIHTIFLWVIYYSMVYFTVLATGINLDWVGIGIVLISTSLAVSVPAAPGYVGTYHAAAVYVLVELFNANLIEAQTFSVIIHAVGFIPLVFIGAVYFIRSGLHLKDMSGKHIVG